MSKGIFWDNDGVLAHTEKLFYQTNRNLLTEHDVRLSVERYVEWFLESNAGAWHVLANRGYTEIELSALRAERSRRYAEALRQSTDLAREDLMPLLTRLRGRARMAIVTASLNEHLRLIHRTRSFFDHFEVIVTREHVHRSKPAPDCYLAALEKMDMLPDQCVVIEDSPRGLAAAVAAGLKCIVLRSDFLGDYPFVGAAAVVNDVDELGEVLEDFLASEGALPTIAKMSNPI